MRACKQYLSFLLLCRICFLLCFFLGIHMTFYHIRSQSVVSHTYSVAHTKQTTPHQDIRARTCFFLGLPRREPTCLTKHLLCVFQFASLFLSEILVSSPCDHLRTQIAFILCVDGHHVGFMCVREGGLDTRNPSFDSHIHMLAGQCMNSPCPQTVVQEFHHAHIKQ